MHTILYSLYSSCVLKKNLVLKLFMREQTSDSQLSRTKLKSLTLLVLGGRHCEALCFLSMWEAEALLEAFEEITSPLKFC